MHHTPREQAVRRAQERATADIAAMGPWAKLFAFILYPMREARYEREELRKAKKPLGP